MAAMIGARKRGMAAVAVLLVGLALAGCYRTRLPIIAGHESAPVNGVLSGTYILAENPLSKTDRFPKNPDRYHVAWDAAARHYRVTNFSGRSKKGGPPTEYARVAALPGGVYLVQETFQNDWSRSYLHVIRPRPDGFEYLSPKDRQMGLGARFGVGLEEDMDTGGIFIRSGSAAQVRSFMSEALRLGLFDVVSIYRRSGP